MPKHFMPSSELEQQAKNVLRQNDQGAAIVPSAGLYPHQVLWDSCFIAIGLSHYDIALAQREISRLLSAQWRNGMIPHIIFSGRDNWHSFRSPLAPQPLATSGVSQPPMLAEAVVRVGEKLPHSERRVWYRRVFPALLAHHQWLYRERDPDNSGLVVQIHPWETGLDNTPPALLMLDALPKAWWLLLLEKAHLTGLGSYFRTDKKFVSLAERGSNIETLRLYALLRHIRHLRYDSAAILASPGFAIQDLTYNSILVRANERLLEIAKDLGEQLPAEFLQHVESSRTALETLWHEPTGQYYSRDWRSGQLLIEPTVATFLPLYSGTISPEQAKRLSQLMQDKDSFGAPYPLPSASLSSPWFQSKRYWQGPTWVNINWLVIQGLKEYGIDAQAKWLTAKTLELASRSGCREYFDPLSGEGAGAQHFSWTAALVLDLLNAGI